eukprot:10860863-Alexandrium_andersonii.AAC.1
MAGLYEYYDTGDESATRTVKKQRTLEWHQSEDIEPGTDHAEQVQGIMDQVGHWMCGCRDAILAQTTK